jgi:TIR domain/Pentapeptide repeats (8 copies)
MDRDEALKLLLKEGQEGHIKWNRYRRGNGPVPDLSKADLSFADLGGSECDFLDDGAPNLSRCNLSAANLSGADLGGVNLSEAILESAHLSGAEMEFTVLRGANLHEANLNGSRLTEVDLRETNLSGADLSSATLTRAELSGANLTGAICESTLFANTDLSGIRGLESVKHQGPSTIGIDTLLESGGTIPEAFLRGCGVPERWIEYLPSWIGMLEPIQFYSCFISHSSKDQTFADRLHSRMVQEKLRVWYAPEDMRGGRKGVDQIDQAIRVHDKLLLVLSKASMESGWVRYEIKRAVEREKREKRQVLFPIGLVSRRVIKAWSAFDSDLGRDLAELVREYHIPDFSRWKDHDSFEAGFSKLLKDLKAEESIGSKHD